MEEILSNIYRVQMPLPGNPLKAINSYIIKGKKRNLTIDTGMNRVECREAMNVALKQLDVDLNRTDFIATHLHADHSGLIPSLATAGSQVYCSEEDGESINLLGDITSRHWTGMRDYAAVSGFPEDELNKAIARHPANVYGPKGKISFTPLSNGEQISIDNYVLQCVETPGHTMGHICFYEPTQKILFSGDHILGDITPNISQWADDVSMLELYFDSLQKIKNLDIKMVLPGHRRVIHDCNQRIEQLRAHHQTRLNEVITILQNKSCLTAYQVASNMSWDLTFKSWQQFPVQQKWFATGEAIAHLEYLVRQKVIRKEKKEKVKLYCLVK